MTRILPLAAAAFLCCANAALAATPLHRDTATTGSTPAPTTQPMATADRFASEAEARSHCRGDTVVWANTKTHVYHFAGNAAYGHTKHGAFMCRADADKTGKFRAAKKEAASATGAGTSMPPRR